MSAAMQITLEQARTLDALAREGTLQAAATRLRKGHPAVLYALKQLEQQTGIALLDRTGYRTRLTAAGDAVLGHCRVMLNAERDLQATCAVLQSGWEPVLAVVIDAIVPFTPFLQLVQHIRQNQAPTKLMLSVDSLEGVRTRFDTDRAQIMVTVLPHQAELGITVHALPKLKARLVAHRSHPLVKQARVTRQQLAQHVLLTVRGSDPRLQLATADLDTQSTVQLSDFHSKKAAILGGLGFGWLPDWLIEKELTRGELRPLRVPHGAVHTFEPRLVLRGQQGKAGTALVQYLTAG